jgi:hypothetical protein
VRLNHAQLLALIDGLDWTNADTIERAPACNCLDLEIAYGICICLALVPIDWKLSRRFEFVPLQESSQFCYLLCCSIFQFGVCLQLSTSELRIIRKLRGRFHNMMGKTCF